MAYTFDGPNKLVILTAQTSLDLRDLWSRWNDWVQIGTNSKYALAFSSVGGNTIDPSAGTSIPAYIFQINGWKIRPQESNHTLLVGGGVLVDLSGDPFADTIGTFRVNIRFSQPVQAITVATGGGGAGATPAQIWAYATRTLTESAGLTPEQDAKLMSLGPTGGGGFSINYDNINNSTKRAIDDARKKIEEKIEAIPQADIEPIKTEIKLASEAIIETIESEADRVNTHTTEAKREVKESEVKTRELVKQKAEKLDSKISKVADRQDQIDKSIDREAEEIERKLDEMYEAEAKEIERRMDEVYEAEADEIEAKLNLQ